MKTFSKREVLGAIKSAPRAIQKAYGSEHTADVIVSIKNKYNLHIDMAGMLGSEVGYLLLGLIDPTAFVQRLQESGIDQNIANSITQDVNIQIFVPLQKKMREVPISNDDEEEEDYEWAASEDSVMPIISAPSSPKMPISVMNVGRSTNISPPTLVQQAAIFPLPETPAASTAPQQTVSATKTIHRTMQQDMQLVKQGNLHEAEFGAPVAPAPTIIPPVPTSTILTPPPQYAARPQAVASSPYVAPIAPPAWHSSAAASFQTASIPNTAPSELNIPRYSDPTQNKVSSGPESFARPAIAVEQHPRSAPPPITKEYNADPYREIPQ